MIDSCMHKNYVNATNDWQKSNKTIEITVSLKFQNTSIAAILIHVVRSADIFKTIFLYNILFSVSKYFS